jgi:hypothetical protein
MIRKTYLKNIRLFAPIAVMKAYNHCYGVELDELGFIDTNKMGDLDYTWFLGQALRIDNVEPWLEKDN